MLSRIVFMNRNRAIRRFNESFGEKIMIALAKFIFGKIAMIVKIRRHDYENDMRYRDVH